VPNLLSECFLKMFFIIVGNTVMHFKHIFTLNLLSRNQITSILSRRTNFKQELCKTSQTKELKVIRGKSAFVLYKRYLVGSKEGKNLNQ
jgi:hypothetical protein